MREGERNRQIKQKIFITHTASGILLVLLHAGLLSSGGPEAAENLSLFIPFSKQRCE